MTATFLSYILDGRGVWHIAMVRGVDYAPGCRGVHVRCGQRVDVQRTTRDIVAVERSKSKQCAPCDATLSRWR